MVSSLHHSFDVDLATQYSIEEAIIIHHFQHWIRVNQKLKRNWIEERTWTYQTREEIAAHFPYLDSDKIRRLCESLVKKKVLISKCHHKNKFDRTLWYAFENESKFLNIEIDSNKSYERQICQMGLTNLPNGIDESAKCILDTDTKTDTITNKRESTHAHEDLFILGKVEMEKHHYDKLVSDLGQDRVDKTLANMDYYAQTKPELWRKFKSHHLVLRKWATDDIEKEKSKTINTLQTNYSKKPPGHIQKDRFGNPIVHPAEILTFVEGGHG
jgi:hypothetical protein